MSQLKAPITKQAELSFEGLDNCLKWYADSRDKENFVGQFLDSVGCKEEQFGIFGISCWLVTSQKSKDEKVISLREKCKLKLVEFVTSLEDDSVSNEHKDFLKENVLKISFVIEALSLVMPPDDKSLNHLISFLLKNQKTDGSWDFIISTKDSGNVLATSIVLRCIKNIRNNSNLLQKVDKAFTYLNKNYVTQKNYFEQLFILNTIQIIKENYKDYEFTLKAKIKRKLVEIVKDLYTAVRLNPTKFSNPINVDYHQNLRTSYFRLPPSSLILLESLILISNRCLPFINAYIGKRIFKDLIDNINQPQFDRDITDHRASSGVYYYKYQTINLLLNKKAINLLFLNRVYGWLACVFSFGANLYLNLVYFIIALPLGLVLYKYEIKPLDGVTLGVAAKAAFDIVKDINDIYKTKK